MKQTLLLVLICLSSSAYSQNPQQEVLDLLNAARTNPKDFITTYVLPYLKENDLENNKYARSLIADLKAVGKLDSLVLSEPLNKTATAHALDMGKRVDVGHDSSDGTPFDERLRNRAKAKGTIGENCDYGDDNALDIVMDLLIDDGIESVGHRKNILEPHYKYIGIGIEKHKTYGTNCVMDFAEAF